MRNLWGCGVGPTYNGGPPAIIRSCIDTKQIWGTIKKIDDGGVISTLAYGEPSGVIIDNDYDWFVPPVMSLDEASKIGVRIEALTIPLEAENKVLAIDYIEYCIVHRNIGQPDLEYMLSHKNPEAYGIDDGLHNEYAEMLSHITFNINALGGTQASYDIADLFAEFIGEDIESSEAAELDARFDRLVDGLNSISERAFSFERNFISEMD